MSARLDASLRVVAGLDDLERVSLVELLIAEMNGDGLARVGVAMVRRCDALARIDPAAADKIAQACQATWRDFASSMAGTLSAAIEEDHTTTTTEPPHE